MLERRLPSALPYRTNRALRRAQRHPLERRVTSNTPAPIMSGRASLFLEPGDVRQAVLTDQPADQHGVPTPQRVQS